MTPIIIDIEASGFGRGTYPIEIGLVLPDGTPHCFLVAPHRSWTRWDPAAEEVHGISREILLCNGRSIIDIAWRLNELLRGKTVYSDAWAFDLSWMGKLYDAAHQDQTFRISSLHDLLSDAQLAHWDQTKEEVISEMALRRHRASGDARILQETYRRVQAVAA